MPEAGTPAIPIPDIQTTAAVCINIPMLPCTDVLPSDTQIIEGTLIDVTEEYTPFESVETGSIAPALLLTLFIVVLCLPSIILQLYLVYSMPRVTVLLLPKEQTITTSTGKSCTTSHLTSNRNNTRYWKRLPRRDVRTWLHHIL